MAAVYPSTAAIYLFRISAALNAISVPGHIAFGKEHVDPSLETLSKGTRQQRTAAAGTANGWDYMNAGFATLAVYNYYWSITGGPKTTPEKTLFWSLLAASLWAARRYAAAGVYSPLTSVAVAPLLSLAGWYAA
ncbi:uncharacterized protein AB675_7730 [Cyphellophora attinorum]|uniref:Ergosterol biosynthetic protein 28 n=1 Tax=Cyphellophora attinorum TaxID=1664694 RepID=A0A0N0NMG0_9EURO|nr:uncharacterized protein AB675_7730 [Phialophora attinorum]KPI40421.1 hypothetical protein AB675_7730 [Phialophora attinorum]